MPIVTSSAGLLFITTLAPLVAAATVAVTPTSDAYTLYGTTFAVVLTLLYLRTKNPHISTMSLGFSLIATGAVGWMMPDVVMWWAQTRGWIDRETVEAFPNKMWTLSGLLAGLGGTTMIRFLLVQIERRGSPLLERVTEVYLPSIKKDDDSTAVVIKQEIKEEGTRK